MKRKTYPKFIEIKNCIINVSTIKTLQKGHVSSDETIDIEYFNGCEIKSICLRFRTSEKRDDAFNKIMEKLL